MTCYYAAAGDGGDTGFASSGRSRAKYGLLIRGPIRRGVTAVTKIDVFAVHRPFEVKRTCGGWCLSAQGAVDRPFGTDTPCSDA